VLDEGQGLKQFRDLLMVSIDINDLRGYGLAAQVRSHMKKGEAICVQ